MSAARPATPAPIIPIADYRRVYAPESSTWGDEWLTADDVRAAQRVAHVHPASYASPARAALVAEVLALRMARARRRAAMVRGACRAVAYTVIGCAVVTLAWAVITFSAVAFGTAGH